MKKKIIIPFIPNRMLRKIILAGGDEKRREYFAKAAENIGAEILCIDYEKLTRKLSCGNAVKLDVPESFETELGAALGNAERYAKYIEKLPSDGVFFLNEPSAIAAALNKKQCKALLKSAGVPVTETVCTNAGNFAELRDTLAKMNIGRVFIKPVYGSGAAGVCALMFGKGFSEAVCYTPTVYKDGKLYNLNRIVRYDGNNCRVLVETLLRYDCIVEHWYKKSVYDGLYYDIRAVWQFGKLDFIAARGSKGFITNLHINNRPIPVEKVLSGRDIDAIAGILDRTARVMPGLRSFGADIILEETPRVIEINGQGDHIYGDIFAENLIYKNQIRYLSGT